MKAPGTSLAMQKRTCLCPVRPALPQVIYGEAIVHEATVVVASLLGSKQYFGRLGDCKQTDAQPNRCPVAGARVDQWRGRARI